MHQTHQNVRYDPTNTKKGTHSPATNQRRRSILSSTPLPEKSIQENIKLCFDQGTQTDSTCIQPPISKIEEIELVLRHLYGRFQSLVMRVNNVTVTNGTLGISESEQNGDISCMEPNVSWATTNNATENTVVDYTVEGNNIADGDIGDQVVETENQRVNVLVNPVKMETNHKNPNNSMRVRRMSAQTTNSNELVTK